MARRSTASSAINAAVAPVMEEFTARLVGVVSALVRTEVMEEFERFIKGQERPSQTEGEIRQRGAAPKKKRSDGRSFTCRHPGCTNSASPRFRFLCKEHRDANVTDNSAAPSESTESPPVPDAAGKVNAPAQPMQEPEQKTDDTNPQPAVNVEPAPTSTYEKAHDNQPEPAKQGCSVEGCQYGWFRPSGNKHLCRAHYFAQREPSGSD